MVSHVDDLTIEYTEDDVLVVKELDKRVLTKRGGWVTIIYKHQDWDRRKEDYGPVKFSIRRYCKRNDVYRQQSKFNISNAKQAQDLIEVLKEWTDGEGE
jgi:hypothetical protein